MNTIPFELLEALFEVAVAAAEYAEDQPDRLWRIANPKAQAVYEALMDLDKFTL